MTLIPKSNQLHAAGFILTAIALASTQDAIVKGLSGDYPLYETVLIRCLVVFPIFGIWFAKTGRWSDFVSPLWPVLLFRSLVLCSAYFAFILSIAAIPIATAIAIYFTMPLFVAALSFPMLKEKVPLYRWVAIVVGFAGVLIMVRPGYESFEPAALLALYSALGYAVAQMMARTLSRQVAPLVIAQWHNVTLFVLAVGLAVLAAVIGFQGEANKSLAFLTRPFAMPSLGDVLLMVAIGILAACAIICFIKAYSLAAAHFVAPFEYAGMAWAVLYGYLFFDDFPDLGTWAGIAIVVGAGLYMLAMDRRHQTG